MGYAALAKLNIQNPQTVADHLEHLQQAAQRARDLIRLILTFSRKEGPHLNT